VVFLYYYPVRAVSRKVDTASSIGFFTLW